MTNFIYKKRYIIILICIIALQLARVIYVFNFEKEGYHSDEIWCYGLANSYYDPFLYTTDNVFEAGDYEDRQNFNEWLDGSVFRDYIEVTPDHRFAYGSVIYNQSMDQLPPFHYMLLHTICSLFPGSFSMWYGLIINLFMLIGSSVCIFLTGKRLFGSEYKALLALAFYGFGIGALQTFMYIRMYATATFFAALLIFLHSKMLLDVKYNLKIWLGLFIATMLGGLTHYVFLFFAFLLAAFFCFYYLFGKKIKRLIFYATAMLAGVGGVLAVFPYALDQLIGNRQGAAVYPSRLEIAYVINRIFIENTGIYTQVYHNADLLYIYAAYVLFAVILLLSVFILRNDERLRGYFKCLGEDLKLLFKKSKKFFNRRRFFVLALFAGTLAEVCITAFICNVVNMEKLSDRYLFCAYPGFCLLFSLWIFTLIELTIDSKKLRLIAMAVFTAVFCLASNVRNVNLYLFPRDPDGLSIAEASKGSDIILGVSLDWLLVTYPNLVKDCDKIFAFNLTEYEDVAEYIKALPDDGNDVYFILDASVIERMKNQEKNGTSTNVFMGINIPNNLEYEYSVEDDYNLDKIIDIFNHVDGVEQFELMGAELNFGRRNVIYKLR